MIWNNKLIIALLLLTQWVSWQLHIFKHPIISKQLAFVIQNTSSKNPNILSSKVQIFTEKKVESCTLCSSISNSFGKACLRKKYLIAFFCDVIHHQCTYTFTEPIKKVFSVLLRAPPEPNRIFISSI